MKAIILMLFILTSCASRKEVNRCITLSGFEKKPVSDFGLTGNGYILQGPKELIYLVVDGIVIPTVACYPAGVLNHPASLAVEFHGLARIYKNCFEKLQKKISVCPDVSKEAEELKQVAGCYDSHSEAEQARKQRVVLMDENAFSGCLRSKATAERK